MIHNYLFSNLSSFKDKRAIVDAENPTRAFTFNQLRDKSLKVAAGLQKHWNIKKGQVVSVITHNTIEFPVVGLGIMASGAVLTALDDFADAASLVTCVKATSTEYIIVHPGALDLALEVAQQVGISRDRVMLLEGDPVDDVSSVSSALVIHDQLQEAVHCEEEDPAYLFFTSGSTGPRKVVTHTHGTITAFMKSPVWHTCFQPDPSQDVVLTYLLLTHAASWTMCVHVGIFKGMTLYVMDGYSAPKLCRRISAIQPSVIVVLPYVLADVVDEPTLSQYDFSNLKRAITLGAFLETVSATKFHQRLNCEVLNCYGMSEIISPFIPTTQATIIGSCGTLSKDMQAKIVDDQDQEVRASEMGELLVKSPCMIKGYHNNPEANKKSYTHDGFFRTGDMFKRDSQGLFTMVSRRCDLIRYKYTQFFPSEVESVIQLHSGVVDCAVIGVLCKKTKTEAARAYVEIRPDQDKTKMEEEIVNLVAQHLVHDKQLHGGVIIMDPLPRTPLGKIDRVTLRNMARDEQLAETSKFQKQVDGLSV